MSAIQHPTPNHQGETSGSGEVQDFECTAISADHPEIQARERTRQQRECLKQTDAGPHRSYPREARMVTKEDAIQRLLAARFVHESNELQEWLNNDGNNQGWDGWIRGAHPHVVATIWPDEHV